MQQVSDEEKKECSNANGSFNQWTAVGKDE